MKKVMILIGGVVVLWPLMAVADELSESLERARAYAKEWALPEFRVILNDDGGISATDAGVLEVGRKFPDHIKSSNPEVRKTALDFIFLHELRHVHQQATMKETFDDPAKRPLIECLADLEAARALVAGNIASLDLNNKEEIKKAQISLVSFRDARPDLVRFLPDQAGASHLTKKERVLAMQFGLWSAYADQLAGAPEKFKDFAANIARKAGLEAEPKDEWDITTCKKIVGSGKEALAALTFWFEPYTDRGAYFSSAFSVRNTSTRDIRVYMTFMEGFHPKGKDEEYENYTFMDAASQAVTLKPDEKVVVDASLPIFDGKPADADLFVWNRQMLGMETSLVAAEFTGKFRLPASCRDYFSASDDTKAQTFMDMARVGSYAADRFSSLWTKSYNTYGMEDIIRPLTIPVRGVATANVYVGSEPNVVLSLYEGTEKEDALATFREWADAAAKYCPKDELRREWISKDDQLPTLSLPKLTPDSDATLYMSAPDEDHPNYEVGWRIGYAR
ncbi:hypothetical protein BMW22_08030 [Rhizobium leguminosarum]|uniref:Uncharacterized protein n=1 Tax=Rhizobium leguminosarum TaxID=384 RepID=A0A1L3Z7D3_RHILE|nr:hypothetical protein [Rhizobium leguminosarum]API51574.1 hypothetical protein BMW22_08030 [Rhizobium leguminosarum]